MLGVWLDATITISAFLYLLLCGLYFRTTILFFLYVHLLIASFLLIIS